MATVIISVFTTISLYLLKAVQRASIKGRNSTWKCDVRRIFQVNYTTAQQPLPARVACCRLSHRVCVFLLPFVCVLFVNYVIEQEPTRPRASSTEGLHGRENAASYRKHIRVSVRKCNTCETSSILYSLNHCSRHRWKGQSDFLRCLHLRPKNSAWYMTARNQNLLCNLSGC